MTATPADPPYLPGLSLAEYAALMHREFPELAGALWLDRPGIGAALASLTGTVNEFEDDDAGRGGSYRRAQCSPLVRARGIHSLFSLAAGVAKLADIRPGWRMLDVLGGDGLLTQVLRTAAPQAATITGDTAGNMVLAALQNGLPAVRQMAQCLLVRDAAVDAVVIAYGSHHIAPPDRSVACAEAARVLRPGGRLVLHDFAESSPVALWFSDVVHRYSRAGHSYRHFTDTEMAHHLATTGLHDIRVHRVYDPFVMHADDPAAARDLLADYLVDMYGLVALADEAPADVRSAAWKLAGNYFLYPEIAADGAVDIAGDGPVRCEPVVYETETGWAAEIPRVALVAVGEK